MLDANARLGSVVSPSVGAYEAAAETVAGASFHEFLASEQLLVPSTFAMYTDGSPSWSWRSPHGPQHHIDYVAVPLQWSSSVGKAFVLEEIALGSCTFEDHRAVAVEVPVVIGKQKSSRKPWFNRAALRLECNRNELARI